MHSQKLAVVHKLMKIHNVYIPIYTLSLQLKLLRQEQLRLEEEVTEKAKVSNGSCFSTD